MCNCFKVFAVFGGGEINRHFDNGNCDLPKEEEVVAEAREQSAHHYSNNKGTAVQLIGDLAHHVRWCKVLETGTVSQRLVDQEAMKAYVLHLSQFKTSTPSQDIVRNKILPIKMLLTMRNVKQRIEKAKQAYRGLRSVCGKRAWV